MSTNPWIKTQSTNPDPRLRLFCFPYAGGAASTYRTWYQHLPSNVQVCAVQLPGRENRIREKPFTSVHGVVQALLPNLLPYLDKPFAFFGHSMGTLLAYELAQQLQQRHGQTPMHLFVSGRRAPFLPDPDPSLHTLPTDEVFLAELHQRYENIPAIIFEDQELRELFVPLLRADFELVETYQFTKGTPLPYPVITFGGLDDARASRAELQAWQELTQSDFDLHMLPGGHFYLNDQIQPLLAILARYL